MKVLYFAWVRQKIGCSEEVFDLPDGVKTIADLAAHLASRGAGYGDAFADMKRVRVALNEEHVQFDALISENDEIAFFPPVTGG